jgi:hypothetical protein
MNLADARLALRRALIRRQLARLELIHAVRAVRDALNQQQRNKTPALLRKQAG